MQCAAYVHACASPARLGEAFALQLAERLHNVCCSACKPGWFLHTQAFCASCDRSPYSISETAYFNSAACSKCESVPCDVNYRGDSCATGALLS